MEIRDTRYARTPDGLDIAYQVSGHGPLDLVWQFDHLGDVDLIWERPGAGAFYRAMAEIGRLILHDRRGTGLSSRNAPPPDLETRSADLMRVLDAAGSERPVLLGYSEGGAANAWFAANHPDRVRSMVWFEPTPRMTWAPDFPWGVTTEYVEAEQRSLEHWGTNDYGAAFADAQLVAEDDAEGPAEDAHILGMLSAIPPRAMSHGSCPGSGTRPTSEPSCRWCRRRRCSPSWRGSRTGSRPRSTSRR